jgi:putative heme transporter
MNQRRIAMFAPASAWRSRKTIGVVVSLGLVVAIFWFGLPRVASYRSVWVSIGSMTWPQALLVAVAAVASFAASWLAICAVLPSIRLRQAAVVNLGSTAVANTLPAGGVLAMGVSWAMFSGWNIGTSEYVLYTLISGIWNIFARLGLPVIALLIIAISGRAETGLLIGSAVGLAFLVAIAAGFWLVLHSESFARRTGDWLQPALGFACRLARRPQPSRRTASLLDFRARAAGLIAIRGWRITATTVASNLALWLVLLASIRSLGLAQSQVPWQTSLAAFAFVRLLTVLPITPGGAGITEIGLVGTLAGGAGHGHAAQVTAAVLLYRAVTYLLPIPVGAIACLAWRCTPSLRNNAVGQQITSEPSESGHRPVEVQVSARGRRTAA